MNPVTVSVVLPTRDRAHTLRAAIDSALAQDVEGCEVIVVDDASVDATQQLLATYGERIRTLTLAESSGVANARNQGVAAAHGEWLAFLDSDDLWRNGKLAAQLSLVRREPGIALCFTDYAVEERGPKGQWQQVAIYGRRPGARDFAALFRRNFIGTLTVLLRREVFHRAGGFDTSLHRGSDYDLWLRIAAQWRIQRLPQVTARYRRHAGSLTGADPDRDRITHAEVTRQWIERDPGVLARVGWTERGWLAAARGEAPT